MSYLYITNQGSKISVDGGYLAITAVNGDKNVVPIETLENISLFGNISITNPAITFLMSNNIPVSFYSQNGKYYGKIVSHENVNIIRQRKQFELTNNHDFTIVMAKKILSAKMHNQRVVLSRYLKNDDECTVQMKILSKKINSYHSIEELMGLEGIVARYYFDGLSRCVSDDFKFKGRSKRPPLDPFNAMLSFGYSMLYNETLGAIEGKGLNAYMGFLHQDHISHATLASDLMEEWRSVIVDSVVLSLVNGHEVNINGFEKTDNGIVMDKETFGIYFRKYNNKMNTLNKYISNEYITYRHAIHNQVVSLGKAFEESNSELYKPIRIR